MNRDTQQRTKKLQALTLTALMVLAGLASLGALAGSAAAAHDDPSSQDRLQFAHRPDGLGWNYQDQADIYVNEIEGDAIPFGQVENASVRAYGDPVTPAPNTWMNHDSNGDPVSADRDGPFLPEKIPKDSITFNPAIVHHDDDDFTSSSASSGMTWISGCGTGDHNLKKHLRMWYQPGDDYEGARSDADLFDPPTRADSLNVESTYYVIDGASFEPQPMCNGNEIPFGTEGNQFFVPPDNTCASASPEEGPYLNHQQPGIDTMRRVEIRDVTPDQDTNSDGVIDELAKVKIQRKVDFEFCDAIQFMDRVYQYRGLGTDAQGNKVAFFRTFYAGNTEIDSPMDHALSGGQDHFFDRSSRVFSTPQHQTVANLRTSYLQLGSFPLGDDPMASLTGVILGKELQTADTFYVDGVRYDVPLVSARESTGQFSGTTSDELISLTLRTPLPKGDGINGEWSAVTNDQVEDLNRVDLVDDLYQVMDWSVVTTQYLVQYDATNPLPIDPPFNGATDLAGTYYQVDDIGVQLWEQGDTNTQPNFPFGPVNPVNGLPQYPQGDAYLTSRGVPSSVTVDNGECQVPQQVVLQPEEAEFCDWVEFYEVEHTDHEETFNLNDRVERASALNDLDSWVTKDLFDDANLFWIKEHCEDRYSSNLDHVLEADGNALSGNDASFERLPINSHPCLYTEMVLPDRPNTVSEFLGANLDTKHPYPAAGTYRLLGEDYLVTTSFGLFDSNDVGDGWTPRMTFGFDPQDTDTPDVLQDNTLDQVGLYLNPLADGSTDLTVRLYGSDGVGVEDARRDTSPSAPFDIYTDQEAAFDPNALARDSATFNPAIILHTDDDFTGFASTFSWIQSCDGDANLEKHLRMWYEPAHEYEGPRTESGQFDPATQADVIQVESTYQLVHGDTYEPANMCPGQTQLPFPTEGTNYAIPPSGDCDGRSSVGHAQPGVDTMQHVTIGDVGGNAPTSLGTVEIERGVTLSKCDTVQMLGTVIQYRGMVDDNGDKKASFDVYHAGNTYLTHDRHGVPVGSDRVWFGPGQVPVTSPTRPSQTQSTYVELVFFNDDMARFTVGQDIHAGDTFYVDGVRYDVPAVSVVDEGAGPELSYLTLRTPLPKSNPVPQTDASKGNPPCGEWTTVPEDQARGDFGIPREDLIDGQCQVVDWSVISTQYLVNICPDCPIPVDPPFNQPYRQVDVTDIQLWTHGTMAKGDTDLFPWGPEQANGLPMFPMGHTYLSRDRVQCNDDPNTPQTEFPDTEADAVFCAWLAYWDAQPTGFDKPSAQVGGIEAPLQSMLSWDPDSGLPVDDSENLYYQQEWCEGRFNTNIAQLLLAGPSSQSFFEREIGTQPCKYTEFRLPDRTNLVSYTEGTLDTSKADQLKAALTSLLGGDYLITTSFQLAAEGGEVAGSTLASFNPYDRNQNCEIETVPEFTLAIREFLDGDILDRFPPGAFGGDDLQAIIFVASHWLEGEYC